MNARHRLLLAAAKAYIEAMRLPAGEKPEDHARFLEMLAGTTPASDARLFQIPDIEVTLTVRLHDIMEVNKQARDLAWWKELERTAKADADDMWRHWADARDALEDTTIGGWKARASAALRKIRLLDRTKRHKRHPGILDRWSTLTDPHVGLPGPRMSQLDALLLIAGEAGMSPANVKRILRKEGVNVTARCP